MNKFPKTLKIDSNDSVWGVTEGFAKTVIHQRKCTIKQSQIMITKTTTSVKQNGK